MKMKKNAKKKLGAAILCMSIVAGHSAVAFVWPTIDAAQIGAFATSLQDGITQVNNVQSQIQNTTTTINTVGDQATSAMKYTADLQGALTKFLPEDLAQFSTVVGKADWGKVTEITASMDIEADGKIAKNTVDGTQVLLDDEAPEEDVQQLIDDAKLEVEECKNKVNKSFDELDENIIDFSDNAQKSVDQLINIINKNKDLKADDKVKYIAEADDIQQQIKSFKSNALDTFQNAKEQYNLQYNKDVLAAYETYSAAVSDFYENKISREDINQAGEQLKQSIVKAEIGIDKDVVNKLVQASQEIVENIENLKEKVIDALSNSREYPEDEPEKTSWNKEKNTEKFVFAYQSQKQYKYTKSIYAKDNNGGKFFIMPKELAECKVGETVQVEDLDKEKTASKIRKNVVCTKMEKTFWCPDDPEDKSCLPYKQAGWKKYEKNGTYHHMSEDYLTAGNVTRDKTRQLINSWARGDNSTFNKLSKMLESASTDTRKMYQILGLINLEATKLWSWVRRNDAMDRGQNVIDRLGQADKLYLGIKKGEDEADDLVQEALKKQLGVVKGENTEDGKLTDSQVFSNVFLYACGNIKAEDISLEVEKKYDKIEKKKKEQQIADCLFKFAEATSRGTINGEEIIKGNKEAGTNLWRRYRTAIMQDTAFQTLYLSMLSNYKSVKDLKKQSDSSSDTTIISLQEGVKNASVARDDYTAGAEINYYATEQVLDILDAEAQSLQTEILQDLPRFDYNTFAKDVSKEEGVE